MPHETATEKSPPASDKVETTIFDDPQERWKCINTNRLMPEIELKSVTFFYDFFCEHLSQFATYIYRGQENYDWPLKTSFDRAVEGTGFKPKELLSEHLERFRLEIRGRRGGNPKAMDDDELLSLGQHYGLATPLLDWTESPFVALYFAIHDVCNFNEGRKKYDYSGVYALSRISVKWTQKDTGEDIAIINPRSDDNARLVSQRGLLLKKPIGNSFESFVNKTCTADTIALLKIKIPNDESDIKTMLKQLNAMNINHATLFPELTGAATYCNDVLARRA